MKHIILAAGEGSASFERNEQIPKCLEVFNGYTTIDHALEFSKNNNNEICLVGGFEILKIMKKYPSLRYFYNPDWAKTGNLLSFLIAIKNLNSDLLITYSDVIYDKSFLKKSISSNQISLQYDSNWAYRYENRDKSSVEVLFYKDNQELGEFTGALYIPKTFLKKIHMIASDLAQNNNNATLFELSKIILKSFPLNLINVAGGWAEIDSNQDKSRFIFGTKSETLSSLKKNVKHSNILGQYTFQVDEFSKNKNNIILKVQKAFKKEYLVIRSSALNEDTHESAMAGNYKSVLKVPKDDKNLIEKAIKVVIRSYLKSGQKQNPKNQVLVQSFLEGVTLSGVVLTKDLQTDSPYYRINYSEGDNTESVTSGMGKSLKVFTCYRYFSENVNNQRLKELITAVKELEDVTDYDAIDVEFAFVGQKLYILQVRPIAARKEYTKISETDIHKEIVSIKKYITTTKEFPGLYGKSTAYGVMPDWNPAEIIGINPKPLSFDLYKYLITDDVWASSRSILGYKDVRNNSGLLLFAGRPYVDIRMSFSSFIPKTINDSLSNKLVDAFIQLLKESPENHDKVEFKVALTAFDFNFDSKLIELLSKGILDSDLEHITQKYKDLTQEIIMEKNISIDKELSYSNLLSKKRNQILKSKLSKFDKVFFLLEDCKKYGTLPFANLARMSFIGTIIIQSLKNKNLIKKKTFNNFFNSIHSIATDFSNDCNLLFHQKMSKEKFLEKYGHLRPGTYEISSSTYNDSFDDYINLKSRRIPTEPEKVNILSQKNSTNITKKILESGLNFSASELFEFTKKAVEAREKSKFEFTKNLSAILDLISEIGREYNISKDELSYLNLEDILRFKKSSSRIDFETNSRKSIANNKKKYLVSSAIQLPELIFNNRDLEMFYYPESKPNFITSRSVFEEVVFIKKDNAESIYNKIVMIESADPGFDWIFSHDIKGLITKYGGVASHMAIRCAEFNLPAAIGCGKIFDELIYCSKVEINCANQKLKGFA